MNSTKVPEPQKRKVVLFTMIVILILLIITLLVVLFVLPKNSTRVAIVPEPRSAVSTSSSSSIKVTESANVDPIESPRRLIVPSLLIDAQIEHAGVGDNGHMEVPNKYENTSWYSPGYRPGEKGNAVIAGHLDNSLGMDAVFANLSQIENGAEVIVEGNDGRRLVFKVVGRETYDYLNAPLSRIFGPAEGSHLNLITCDGTWIDEVKSYEKRLIIFTRLVGEEVGE